MDSKATSGNGQGQDFESTKSFKFFTVFFYGKTFDYHEIYVHGVLKKWSARRKPSILSSGA